MASSGRLPATYLAPLNRVSSASTASESTWSASRASVVVPGWTIRPAQLLDELVAHTDVDDLGCDRPAGRADATGDEQADGPAEQQPEQTAPHPGPDRRRRGLEVGRLPDDGAPALVLDDEHGVAQRDVPVRARRVIAVMNSTARRFSGNESRPGPGRTACAETLPRSVRESRPAPAARRRWRNDRAGAVSLPPRAPLTTLGRCPYRCPTAAPSPTRTSSMPSSDGDADAGAELGITGTA